MAAAVIDFWFTMGSTYTGLTVARYEVAVGEIPVRLRPFKNVGALTGTMSRPFTEGTAKMRYMYRDIERRAVARGLPLRMPFAYPAPDPVRANRVALVGVREGWGASYLRAAYRLWFTEGIGNGGEENLWRSLADAGQEGEIDRILALADSPEVTLELDAATEEARNIGIFGAPTFVVADEIFWGDDHLEDAIAWSRQTKA
ncbi:2-hydroxychromene-2-carboxylate isomerase [Roseomonas sp. KE2513]|uniref:2-hydroxychromene-2-carboxylate isomerase n=1 Tax=Roseomonas sp. KE2513 TaxID=2479202 RepID=UPI0018DFFA7F|nr:DsbA family protein [Roseomonas sp. KE2513]